MSLAAHSQGTARRIERIVRATLLLALTGAALYLGLAVWLGWRELAAAIARLGALAIGLGVLVSLGNYLLRFGRWQLILSRMRLHPPAWRNLVIYLGGLALTATPGKVGETVRSVLLLRLGVPVGASLAAFFADRLSDLVGVFALTAWAAGNVWWLAAALAALALGFAVRWVMRHPRARAWLHARRGPAFWHRLLRLVDSGHRHFCAAWRGPRVLVYAAAGGLAYALQGLVFAAYVSTLWPAIEWQQALHIFCVATLAGAASMIPGGLGAMELTMIALLVAAGMPGTLATAAAVAIRAVTLWFGILLGVTCLIHLRREAAQAIPTPSGTDE